MTRTLAEIEASASARRDGYYTDLWEIYERWPELKRQSGYTSKDLYFREKWDTTVNALYKWAVRNGRVQVEESSQRQEEVVESTPNRTVERNREAVRVAEEMRPPLPEPIRDGKPSSIAATELVIFLEKQKRNAVEAYDMWMELDEEARHIVGGLAKSVAEQWKMIAEVSEEYVK